MKGKTLVYNPQIDFDVVVYYDVVEAGERCLVSIYDNNCRFLCLHTVSSLTFCKSPEYWVSQICRQHFEGADEGEPEARPRTSPIFAACRENGDAASEARERLLKLLAE